MDKRRKRETKVIDGILYQKCNVCKEWFPATTEYFHYHEKKKGILTCRCKKCSTLHRRKYHEKVKEIENKRNREWGSNNKERVKEVNRIYYLKNKKDINRKAKEYYQRNAESILQRNKEYREANKDKVLKREKNYRENNPEKIKMNGTSWASLSIYAPQLTIEESPIDDGNGYLLAKCTYCGKYFHPTNLQVRCRIRGLKDQVQGECRLYCSKGCKSACPIYNQKKWPKGFKPASSREVDPLIRQMCLERDDYTCQRCEKTIDEIELHAHHIEGATQMPMLANDVDNTITLCKKCHKWTHKQDGCTTYDLRCKK